MRAPYTLLTDNSKDTTENQLSNQTCERTKHRVLVRRWENSNYLPMAKSNFLFIGQFIRYDRCAAGLEHNEVLERQRIHALTNEEDQCRHVKHSKPCSTESEGQKWRNCFLRAQTCRIWRSSTIASIGFSHRYNQRRPLANMRRRINEALLGEENNVDMCARQASRRARTTTQVYSSSARATCSLRRL